MKLVHIRVKEVKDNHHTEKGQAQFKSKCQRCGKSPYHSRFKCKKRGHYQVVCQSTKYRGKIFGWSVYSRE